AHAGAVQGLRRAPPGKLDEPLVCPDDVLKAAPDVCANEQKLLSARRDTFQNKLQVLQSRQEQAQGALREAEANLARYTESLDINAKQLELISSMVKRGLMAQTDLIKVQAENAELTGEIKVGKESIVKLQAAVQEADLQVRELGLELQQEAGDELTQSLADLSVVEETIRGATDKVKQ